MFPVGLLFIRKARGQKVCIRRVLAGCGGSEWCSGCSRCGVKVHCKLQWEELVASPPPLAPSVRPSYDM